MLDKIIEIIMTILPFSFGNSRKKRQMMAQEVERVQRTSERQYTFLMQQFGERNLKDCFDLSSKGVKEMHAEIFSLRGRLTYRLRLYG